MSKEVNKDEGLKQGWQVVEDAATYGVRLTRLETNFGHVATKTDIEKLKKDVEHMATKTDIERLKVWVLSGVLGGMFSASILAATIAKFF